MFDVFGTRFAQLATFARIRADSRLAVGSQCLRTVPSLSPPPIVPRLSPGSPLPRLSPQLVPR